MQKRVVKESLKKEHFLGKGQHSFHWLRFSPLTRILLVLFIALAFFTFFYYRFETNCYNNEACFNALATHCQKARMTLQKEGNVFQYTILGKKQDQECLVNIKLIQLNQQYDAETKKLLEQKEMICKIPQEKLATLTQTEAVLDYCTGPLKEGMYELIIKRIYGALAENIGPVITKTGIGKI